MASNRIISARAATAFSTTFSSVSLNISNILPMLSSPFYVVVTATYQTMLCVLRSTFHKFYRFFTSYMLNRKLYHT